MKDWADLFVSNVIIDLLLSIIYLYNLSNLSITSEQWIGCFVSEV